MEIKKEYIEQLDQLMHVFYNRMRKFDAEFDLNGTQGATSLEISVLGAVGRNPDIMLKEICEKLQIPGSTLTNVVDRLERRKLLNRVICKRDRRSYGLLLTEEGRRVYRDHEIAEQIMWEKVLTALDGHEEIETFLNLAKKIAGRIK